MFCFLNVPAVWLAGIHVVVVQVPQPSQLITNETQRSVSYVYWPTAYCYSVPNWGVLLQNYSTTPGLDHVLSHKYFGVRPFPEEVFWGLSFPRGSFGFVIYCPVEEKWNQLSLCQPTPSSHNTICCCNNGWIKALLIQINIFSTFLSQSSGSPRFSSHSSSPLCWGYAVKKNDSSVTRELLQQTSFNIEL